MKLGGGLCLCHGNGVEGDEDSVLHGSGSSVKWDATIDGLDATSAVG